MIKKMFYLVFAFSIALATPLYADDFAPFDVDQNGKTTAETDGLIILKVLLNQPFSEFTNLIDPKGKRNTLNGVYYYVSLLKSRNILDVDGDGRVNVYTDGILIYNSLSGNQLTDAVIDATTNKGSIRKSKESITQYLNAHSY